jgi:hypothetical protein
VSGWTIAKNLARINERIAQACARAGRRADEITLVAVSKTFPAEAIRAACECGIRHFGENRVQEWEGKHAQLADLRDATWHLIGHLQSNKARRAAELFHCIDSVDSVALAEKLARCVPATEARAKSNTEGAEAQRTPRRGALPVLIEVRLAPEETKSGVDPSGLLTLAQAILALPQLELRGLMCIPPFFEDPEKARPCFRRLRELREQLRKQSSSDLTTLSMGMSHDFEIAVEEGATELRVGTALFGARGTL